MLYLPYMKPLLFLAFLGLAPAFAEQVTPPVAELETVHAVVGDVEQLPDRDPVAESGAGALRGHDPIASASTGDRAEVMR